MTDEIDWLRLRLLEVKACLDSTTWYVFGSATRSKSVPTDIDVLILYRDCRDVTTIRERVAAIDLERPVHLVFMTHEEEHELDFIKSERCVPFTVLM